MSLILQAMSKHSIPAEGSDIWKKVRYGATAAVAAGTGLYALTSAIKKQGFVSNLVDEVKTAMHACPQLMTDAPPKMRMPTADYDEARAVLKMQLEFAMQRGEMQRVQEISRQLDHLDAHHVNGSTDIKLPAASMPQMLQMQDQFAMQTKVTMPSGLDNPVIMQAMQTVSTDVGTGQAPMPGMPMLGMPDAHISTGMQVPPKPDGRVPDMRVPEPQLMTHGMQAPGMQAPGMPTTGMPTTGMPTTEMQGPLSTNAPAPDKQMRSQTPLGGNDGAGRVRKVAKSVDPTRHAAMLKLQGGDIVEALDPVNGNWVPGSVHTIAKNGLVEVRWDDPGTDANGRPFHPIGEIWAEQIRLKHRPTMALLATDAPPVPEPEEEKPMDPPDGLQVGDTCYAVGQVVEKKWFHAKLLGVRARSPPLRIEYLSTLDGQTNELLLPSSRKDYVNVDEIRRNKPEDPPQMPPLRRPAPNQEEPEKVNQETRVAEQDNDSVVISPDLMCSICERPDDEPNMLVCDCKKGFHIYCLSPVLDAVPEGDWKCPKCATKQ